SASRGSGACGRYCCAPPAGEDSEAFPRVMMGEGINLSAQPPHPILFVEMSCMPSPRKRGEGALTSTELAATRLSRQLRDVIPGDPAEGRGAADAVLTEAAG